MIWCFWKYWKNYALLTGPPPWQMRCGRNHVQDARVTKTVRDTPSGMNHPQQLAALEDSRQALQLKVSCRHLRQELDDLVPKRPGTPYAGFAGYVQFFPLPVCLLGVAVLLCRRCFPYPGVLPT